jgi:hypothetical protein
MYSVSEEAQLSSVTELDETCTTLLRLVRTQGAPHKLFWLYLSAAFLEININLIIYRKLRCTLHYSKQ